MPVSTAPPPSPFVVASRRIQKLKAEGTYLPKYGGEASVLHNLFQGAVLNSLGVAFLVVGCFRLVKPTRLSIRTNPLLSVARLACMVEGIRFVVRNQYTAVVPLLAEQDDSVIMEEFCSTILARRFYTAEALSVMPPEYFAACRKFAASHSDVNPATDDENRDELSQWTDTTNAAGSSAPADGSNNKTYDTTEVLKIDTRS
eukprot:NODE_1610_length_925_cov_507.301370_g1126_i0.p1 GENE.NODE_1610_length_925_cov_507.301370_g1126_i0~~NODE_1610_length_925_cov_507.301370_g1126_i0.p1  ORF type:complete len:201 (+),score=33.11 NODE_1610_length_925_cov_507.301370_g1126_i0:115-717(+)